MLHNPIKGNKIQGTIQAYTCPYADHQPMGVSKGPNILSESSHAAYQIKGDIDRAPCKPCLTFVCPRNTYDSRNSSDIY